MRLVTHVGTAYCLAPGTSIVVQRGDKDEILYVDHVERRWREESGRAQPCADGSLRYFKPETHSDGNNGQNPCLVFFKGEPRPWYFESGWDHVNVISQQFNSSD